MVSRLPRALLEEEKGLLFWRRDEDGNGNLELAASEGFEHDPENSTVVRRVAEEVLEGDGTVWESSSCGTLKWTAHRSERGELIAAEISADFKDGPEAHVATTTRRPHDTGDTAIDHACNSLSPPETPESR